MVVGVKRHQRTEVNRKVKEAIRRNSFPSSLDDLPTYIEQVETVRSFLDIYGGQHPVLVDLQRKMWADPHRWVPSERECAQAMRVISALQHHDRMDLPSALD